MAEQMYFLKNLPGLFAEGEALPAREHAVLHRFSSQPTSFPFSLTLAAFSVRFHLCLQILFSREAELRQLVLQVVLESKSSGWILGLCLLAV